MNTPGKQPYIHSCGSTLTNTVNNPQKQRRPVLMVGGSGTAKTTTALMYFDTLKNDSMLVKRINFSSATTAGMFQATIEGELDKRGGKNFGPPSGCGMTVFLDDVSMPEVRNVLRHSTGCLKRGFSLKKSDLILVVVSLCG